jgi:ABC-type lipoprotein release transport system permease subunit
MLKNYFTIAVRHLLRHKFFSAINILCLAIGITFSLIIGIYVLSQYNINGSLKNINNQYIVKSNWKVKEMGLDITTFGPLPKTLKEEYPSLIANYYRYNPVTNVVSAGEKYFKKISPSVIQTLFLCTDSLFCMETGNVRLRIIIQRSLLKRWL